MLNKRGLLTAGLCCCVSMLGWAQHTEAAPSKVRDGTERVQTRSTQLAAAAANKVTICHKAGPVKFFALSVDDNAVPGHLRHGDCVVDDGVACTVDRCDAAVGCVHTPDNGACNDASACTADSCNPTTGCVNSPITCNDNNACTNDSCDPASGCVYRDIICDDNNPCTDDVCNGGVCEYTPDDTNSCEDGVFCNGTASCSGGSCVAVDACAAAIDLENCLVYGRCVEDSDDHCPGDPLTPCCGNGIVEDGEQCEVDADCPTGFFCDACTCTEEPSPECDGASCSTFIPCNPGSGCQAPVCATTDRGGVCLEGATGCAGLLDCAASADCPDNGVCAVGTCCGRNVCIPTSAFCLVNANATAVVPTAPIKTQGSTVSQGAN